MLVGEAPGAKEEQTGRCFVGKSGQELDRILERCDLDRAAIYTTNVCKERPPYVNGKQLAPSREDIERDEQELIDELLRAKPKWVGAVGRIAASWFIPDFHDMESAHGLCYPVVLCVKCGKRSNANRENRNENSENIDVLDLERSEERRWLWPVPESTGTQSCVREINRANSLGIDTRPHMRSEIVCESGPSRTGYARRECAPMVGKDDHVQERPASTHGGDSTHKNCEEKGDGTHDQGVPSVQAGSKAAQLAQALGEVECCASPSTIRFNTVALYHPAAALHNQELAPFVWWDIKQLAGYVSGQLPPILPVDLFPHPSYTRDPDVASGMYGSVVACDTEGLPGRIWGGSVSSTPGTAWVGSVLEAQQLREVLNHAPTIVFQSALHDVPILEEIGIPVDWAKVEDTFLMAYCLRLVPLGLKQLARRFCGMEMQSYLDVVAPADRRLALEYVERALNTNKCVVCDGTGKVPERRKDDKGWKKQLAKCPACIDGGLWPDRSAQLKYDWDTGNWKLTKGWSVGRYLRNLRKDMDAGKYEEQDEETGETLSVRTRINNWPDDVVEFIEGEIGELAEPTLDDIPAADATYYSARDADATIRVYPILSQQIDQLKLRDAYKLDLSVIPVAAEMQKNGMYIDRQYFAEFVKELEDDNQIILARIEAAVGHPLNPASGDQVAGLLFGEKGLGFSANDEREFGTGWSDSFGLEPESYTKSGKRGSTNDKTLEGLKLKHSSNAELVRIIDLILDYRVRDKILGTYARKMPLLADRYDRVHTTIKPCRTATFRWSSSDPNLQNIPTRKKGNVDLGKRVRQGFVAPEGYVLGSWDFDQIEMRVLAWYSQDEALLKIFREGLDIHSMTAALVWRIPFDQFMAELEGDDKVLAAERKGQRLSAKNIGFGVVYGVTAKGLKAQMELRGQYWTEEECQELINKYLYEAYPGIGRFMMEAHAEARRNGYVRSLFGHIRYVPGVHSSIPSVREEALRQAANFKIQCTAAELLKVAMRTLWHEYRPVLDEVGSSLLMAVHDELLLQVPDNPYARQITDAIVTAAMTDPVFLDGVTVGTTGKFDYNWALLK